MSRTFAKREIGELVTFNRWFDKASQSYPRITASCYYVLVDTNTRSSLSSSARIAAFRIPTPTPTTDDKLKTPTLKVENLGKSGRAQCITPREYKSLPSEALPIEAFITISAEVGGKTVTRTFSGGKTSKLITFKRWFDNASQSYPAITGSCYYVLLDTNTSSPPSSSESIPAFKAKK